MPSKLNWERFKKAAGAATDKTLGALYTGADELAAYRYGMSASDKHRKAVSGEIPGFEGIKSEADIDRENRRAAGYLFGKNQPGLARPLTAAANTIRKTLGENNPDLQRIATAATEQGIVDAKIEPPPMWRRGVEALILNGPGMGGMLNAYNQLAAPEPGTFMASDQIRNRRR